MRWPWQKVMDNHKADHVKAEKTSDKEKLEMSLRLSRVQRKLKILEAKIGHEGG